MKDITCVERLYRVKDRSNIYFVKAKRELSRELTDNLLLEDVELRTFLENYDIFLSKEEIVLLEHGRIEGNEEILEETTLLNIPEEHKGHANLSSVEDRISIITNELPQTFGMYDFIDNLTKKGISEKDARFMWKSTISSMKVKHLVKKIGAEKSKMKYELISTGVSPEPEKEKPELEKEKPELEVPEDRSVRGVYDKTIGKVNIFINNRHRKGRDFSTVEVAEYLGVNHAAAGHIIYRLKKHGLIARSNPEVKEKHKYRYIKAEPLEIEKHNEIKNPEEEALIN